MDARHARAYFELGCSQQARQAVRRRESRCPRLCSCSRRVAVRYAYGEIYRLQDRLEEALNAYKKALELDPPYPKAITKLTVVLVKKKKYDEAEALLIPMVRRDGKNHVAYLNLGFVYEESKKKKAAIDNYQKFLEYAPKNDPERGRVKDAIADLKRR